VLMDLEEADILLVEDNPTDAELTSDLKGKP
jgi:hypothetical protein